MATPAGGRRPEATTAANWRTSPRVLQDITGNFSESIERVQSASGDAIGRIRNLQTGVDKMNKEMTVVKDLAETLSLLWKGQQELNEKLRSKREAEATSARVEQIGQLLWDTNAKVDQIAKDLKTIKNRARDQSTLEAGRAVDTNGLKKEMNDQTSKILQNVREAIETRGEKTAERTVDAVNLVNGVVANVVGAESRLGRELMKALTTAVTEVKQAQEEMRRRPTESQRPAAGAGAAPKGRDTNEAGQKPTGEEVREQVGRAQEQRGQRPADEQEPAGGAAVAAVAPTRRDTGGKGQPTREAKRKGTHPCDGKGRKTHKCDGQGYTQRENKPAIRPHHGEPARRSARRVGRARAAVDAAQAAVDELTSTEEESITSEDTVWIGSSSEDEEDPSDGGAPGAASGGEARGATEDEGEADKQEEKTPEPKTTSKPGDGGCKEKEEAKSIRRVNYHLRPESTRRVNYHQESQCYACDDCGLRTTSIEEAYDHVHADEVGAAATAMGATSGNHAGEEETEGVQGEDAIGIMPGTDGRRPEDGAEPGGRTETEVDPLEVRGETVGENEAGHGNGASTSSVFTRPLSAAVERILHLAESTPVRQNLPNYNNIQTRNAAATVTLVPMTPQAENRTAQIWSANNDAQAGNAAAILSFAPDLTTMAAQQPANNDVQAGGAAATVTLAPMTPQVGNRTATIWNADHGAQARGATAILTFVPMTPDPTSRTAPDQAMEARGQEYGGSGDWDPRGSAGDTEDARASDASKRKTPPTGRTSAGKRKRPSARERIESRAEPRPQPAGGDSDEEERRRIGRETGAKPRKKSGKKRK